MELVNVVKLILDPIGRGASADPHRRVIGAVSIPGHAGIVNGLLRTQTGLGTGGRGLHRRHPVTERFYRETPDRAFEDGIARKSIDLVDAPIIGLAVFENTGRIVCVRVLSLADQHAFRIAPTGRIDIRRRGPQVHVVRTGIRSRLPAQHDVARHVGRSAGRKRAIREQRCQARQHRRRIRRPRGADDRPMVRIGRTVENRRPLPLVEPPVADQPGLGAAEFVPHALLDLADAEGIIPDADLVNDAGDEPGIAGVAADANHVGNAQSRDRGRHVVAGAFLHTVYDDGDLRSFFDVRHVMPRTGDARLAGGRPNADAVRLGLVSRHRDCAVLQT